jgi:peroxiredoxin
VGLGIWYFQLRGNDGPGNTHGLGVVALAAGQNPTGKAPAAETGRAAPGFRLAGLNGGTVNLTDYRGKYVLLNFWASWCGPCRGETPALQKLYSQAGNKDLVVIGVNQQETQGAAKSFIDEFGVTYPVALDRSGDVSVAYRANILPVSVLIDPQGVIRQIWNGKLTDSNLAQVTQTVAAAAKAAD